MIYELGLGHFCNLHEYSYWKMYKTFFLVTQEAEKLVAKHLRIFLKHPVPNSEKKFLEGGASILF